ncbi:MAG TPA: hypothetical protein VGL93_17710 [Streptosporangiaceae bacterium]
MTSDVTSGYATAATRAHVRRTTRANQIDAHTAHPMCRLGIAANWSAVLAIIPLP